MRYAIPILSLKYTYKKEDVMTSSVKYKIVKDKPSNLQHIFGNTTYLCGIGNVIFITSGFKVLYQQDL